MSISEELRFTLALLQPRLPRLLLAIVTGALSLGSALALAGVSAWLITRAWEMPPVLDLSVAVVAVRALGISRGVLHYCERLVTHDTALRAAGSARVGLYRRLVRAPAGRVARVSGGDLAGRLGSDVDELADVLVRAVLPIAVAVLLAVAAVGVIGVISPAAAAVLAGCLFVAGVVAPALSARAAAAQETLARGHHADRDALAMLVLEHAPELRVSGRLDGLVAEVARRQREWDHAINRAAVPAAVGAAVPTAAIGVSVLGAVVAGIGLSASLAPTTLAVLMLLPLSAFEATTALPGAAIALTRSRIAARRLADLTADAAPATPASTPAPADAVVRAEALRTGHSHDTGSAVTLALAPGSRLAVTGPSGSGKTTLLMTLAGLLPARGGQLSLGGIPVGDIDEHQIRSTIAYFAEDSHVFDTTVRDNLLVVRGDCTDAELTGALQATGLGDWLAGLPDGLGTVLTGGAVALSAGQRRRLLLARALLSRAPVLLLDEPTEHLDAAASDELLRALLTPGALFDGDRTIVVATHHLPGDIRCPQLNTQVAGYSGCRSSTPA